MNELKELIEFAKDNYHGRESIDEDVLKGLKERQASVIDAAKVIVSFGFSLRDAHDILAQSKYYAEGYNKAMDFTESVLETMETICRKEEKKKGRK